MNPDLNFIGSEVTAQTRLRIPITLWPIASHHLTGRKKCDDVWLPGTESFPTIYNMNDLAAIIFSCYYTFKQLYILSLTLLQGLSNILRCQTNFDLATCKRHTHPWYVQPHISLTTSLHLESTTKNTQLCLTGMGLSLTALHTPIKININTHFL